MKILILSNKFPYPAKDGSSIAIMRMIDTMLAAKLDVHLFSINTNKHRKDPEVLIEKYKGNLSVKAVDINTDISASNTLINLLSGQPFHVSRFYQANVATELETVLKAEAFDIVQFEGVFMAPYLDLVKKYTKAKTVLRPHNVEYKIWERFIKSEKNILKSLYLSIQTNRLKSYELESIPQFDAVLPISISDETFFKSLTLAPVYTIPCATDLKKYPLSPSVKNNFFHLGAMDWMPNVSGINWFLNEIWPLVLSKNPDSEFVLAGKNMPQDLLNHNQKGVTVLGEIEDASKFYSENGILIVPLLSGSGIRIKIIEGLSYGKAIISTTIGAQGINLENDKNIALRDNPDTFANCMLQLQENKDARIAMGTQARDLAKSHFDVNLLGQSLLTFYQQII